MGLLDLFRTKNKDNAKVEVGGNTKKQSKSEKFARYQAELRPVADRYIELITQIKSDWSRLIHIKDYKSTLANKIEKDCLAAIVLYEKIQKIDKKYDEDPMTGSPVFSKLALLYERRNEYENAISVCKKAYEFKIDETNRMLKLIKKAGREPTEEERKIISDDNLFKQPVRKNNKTNEIEQNEIDKNQQIPASKNYCDKVYSKYYHNYPIKPFISKDREVRTQWLEQSEMFPEQSLVPKNNMIRYIDGLLPGHVYMLYWIKNVNRKRIPSYFEYKYGIQFSKEKEFLTDNGYLKNGKLTEKGESAIELHNEVIKNH